MDIQTSAMDGAQSAILERVGVAVLSRSLKGEESQAAEVLKSLAPAPLPESSGARVDLFA